MESIIIIYARCSIAIIVWLELLERQKMNTTATLSDTTPKHARQTTTRWIIKQWMTHTIGRLVHDWIICIRDRCVLHLCATHTTSQYTNTICKTRVWNKMKLQFALTAKCDINRRACIGVSTVNSCAHVAPKNTRPHFWAGAARMCEQYAGRTVWLHFYMHSRCCGTQSIRRRILNRNSGWIIYSCLILAGFSCSRVEFKYLN